MARIQNFKHSTKPYGFVTMLTKVQPTIFNFTRVIQNQSSPHWVGPLGLAGLDQRCAMQAVPDGEKKHMYVAARGAHVASRASCNMRARVARIFLWISDDF